MKITIKSVKVSQVNPKSSLQKIDYTFRDDCPNCTQDPEYVHSSTCGVSSMVVKLLRIYFASEGEKQ